MGMPLLTESVGVSFPGLGIHDLPVDRIAFYIGSLPVYWYGICIIVGFALCILLAMRHSRSYGLTPDDIIDYTLVVIPAAIIGARLYYVAFSWEQYKDNLLAIFDIRNGGLAVLGGVLLSILAVYIMARIKKQRVMPVFDFLIVYIPLGQAIGRWGNFFNQEAFGTNTTLPWGMISAETSAYIKAYAPGLDPNLPVHPTFLYESLACFLIFGILLAARKRAKVPLTAVALYFILYGIARFFIEGLRTDSLFIGNSGLRISQVLSAVLVVGGFIIIALCRYLKLEMKPVKDISPVSPETETTKDDTNTSGKISNKIEKDQPVSDLASSAKSGEEQPRSEGDKKD